MSFSDPQSVTVNAVAVPLPRTSAGTDSGGFTSADGQYQLSVSHSRGKRYRRTIRLSQTKISADPFVADRNVQASMSAYIVVDTPVNGYTTTEAKLIVDALTGYLTASSGQRVTQLLGGEQ